MYVPCIVDDELNAQEFLPNGGRVVIAGHNAFHRWVKSIPTDQRASKKVFMVNLRESSATSDTLKTSACVCAKQFADFIQLSTKDLEDKNGAYLPAVLEKVVREIIAALCLGWIVYIHCNSGIHRAPSAALALLLKHNTNNALSFNAAKLLVKNSRKAAFRGENLRQADACVVFLDQLEAAFRWPTSGFVSRPRKDGTARDEALLKPLAEELQKWVPFEALGAETVSAAASAAAITGTAGAGASVGAVAGTPTATPSGAPSGRRSPTAAFLRLSLGRDAENDSTAISSSKRPGLMAPLDDQIGKRPRADIGIPRAVFASASGLTELAFKTIAELQNNARRDNWRRLR